MKIHFQRKYFLKDIQNGIKSEHFRLPVSKIFLDIIVKTAYNNDMILCHTVKEQIMLNIIFGDHPDAIYNTNVYFNNTYKDRWITTELAKEVIKAVDRSEVIDEKTIHSPLFGNISPKRLSAGTKTVLLIAFDRTKVFNASNCGDNCAEYILRIAEDRKVLINLRHLMDFGKGKFRIKVVNTGKIVNDMGELVLEAGEFV